MKSILGRIRYWLHRAGLCALSPEQSEALRDYWAAENWLAASDAYARMRRAGFPPAYGE